MICPECKAEYREGFLECVDCNIPLVDVLPVEYPSEESHEPVELKTIITTTDFPHLAIIKSILDGAEIPYITRGEEILAIFPGLPSGKSSSENGGIVAVRVPADRAEEAKLLLEQTEIDDEDVSEDE